ncbi:hypothetical protein BCR33DRAFT_683173 [Rhizoclosmatium globosum]|uniref:Uncharacterized protein n=1 Tax=Rhizoclosmatium globosum TaxID=329046 RepID=A0A1Y2BR80_9FUNG|nr:hypothetical protein BCR33DRAFT_683173 [Rhizoclosmatium globosum]|eukprot:ORY37260.1 hypothetical protein BCR33DRAFT_683173 [Rhizoclosmatium globosum]
MFRLAPGACLSRGDGLTFKVMNSMKKVAFFTSSLPEELYHVLVLIPTKPSPTNSMASLTGNNEIVFSQSTISLELALKHLSARVQIDGVNKNAFTVQESIEAIYQPANMLTLKIQGVDGVPDLLYSSEIYDDEVSIGVKMPVDELISIKQKTIILIGVSGCGKTRTCFDYARHEWCIYFDCTKDADLVTLISQLEAKIPIIKTEINQERFESVSKKCIRALIGTRMLVLSLLLQHNPNLQKFEWLCFQQSRRTQLIFEDIYTQFATFPAEIVLELFNSMKRKFNGRVIFDESQYLLTILKFDYRSSKPDQRLISNNMVIYPRSLFSFMAECVSNFGLKSIWCGTHMRIRNMDLIFSAAGGKPSVSDIHVFTKFTYLNPSQIYSLCSKWIQDKVFQQYRNEFETISQFLQGRPRFFTSFLSKLILSNNVAQSFDLYRREMTTDFGTSVLHTSPYYFWKERCSDVIEPIIGDHDVTFNSKKLVSGILLKLCVASMFGNGSSIPFKEDLDLVSTSLVMVDFNHEAWKASMAEPIVLSAAMNFLSNMDPEALQMYFANQIFAPLTPLNLTPQERGHWMELIISVRFMQVWWQEPQLRALLPQWVNDMNIQKPVGILDCRREKDGDTFLQQLRNPSFPYVVLPAVNAGPDLRYSVFSCHIKTTSTRNSLSTMYIAAEESRENIKTMKPEAWYKSKQLVHSECFSEVQNLCFVHMRFELPDIAPAIKSEFRSGPAGNGHVICVNLQSEFALRFFGTKFVGAYTDFVQQVINNQ